MNASIIALVGSIVSACVSICIAAISLVFNRIAVRETQQHNEKLSKELQKLNTNTSKELEELKAQLNILNNLSILRYTKSFELQLNAIQLISKEFSDLEDKFYTMRVDVEDNLEFELLHVTEGLSRVYGENRFFLNDSISQTIKDTIVQMSGFYIDVINFLRFTKNGDIEDPMGEILKGKFYRADEKLISLRNQLSDQVKDFLNGNKPVPT